MPRRTRPGDAQPPVPTQPENSPDPFDLVRAFLSAVEPHAEALPDPFEGGSTLHGPSKYTRPPVKLFGKLAELAERAQQLIHDFVRRRGETTQQFISRGTINTTAYDSALRALFRDELMERSRLRQVWYAGLSPAERAACDRWCLDVAGPTVIKLIPSGLLEGLHGSLARLALEYAGIVHRAAAERREKVTSLAGRGFSEAVVKSILSGLTHDLEDEKRRMIGWWFRELTPQQARALDPNQPAEESNDPAHPEQVYPRKPRVPRPPKKPGIPPEYRTFMQRWISFSKESAKAEKRATKNRFQVWLRKHPAPGSMDEDLLDDFHDWRINSYERQLRRRK